MDFFILIMAAVYFVIKYSVGQENDKKKTNAKSANEWSKKFDDFGRDISAAASSAEKKARKVVRTFDMTGGKSTGRRIEREQIRSNAEERRSSERRWAQARAKQADFAHIHAANIDSCEGRLESLKTLYEAGILDREEYTQRVARIKSQHARR